MEAGTIAGAVVGVVAGWILAAVFSKGPGNPIEALTGDYERSGPGCFLFLLLVGGGGVVGAIVGTAVLGG